MSRSTGPTATRQAYAVLKAIMNTAVQDEVLTRNPCNITGAGQARNSERPLLGLDEVISLAAEMPEHLRVLAILAFWAARPPRRTARPTPGRHRPLRPEPSASNANSLKWQELGRRDNPVNTKATAPSISPSPPWRP